MQTIENRFSQPKDIHDKETNEGYFAAAPSGGGGVLSMKWGLDFKERICSSFPTQISRSTGAFRVANDLMIGDASIRVNKHHFSSNYWFGNLDFHGNLPRSSTNKNWLSVLMQIDSAERKLQTHRVVGNILTTHTEPEWNRTPIFAKNHIQLSRKGENT